MTKEEKILEIIGEWKMELLNTGTRKAKAALSGDRIDCNNGIIDGLSAAVDNLTERLTEAGFIGSSRPCGQEAGGKNGS